MIYSEFSIFPIKIDINTRMITFWDKLVETQNSKLSSVIYTVVFSMYNHSNFISDWIGSIRNILNECGLPYTWDSQEVFSLNWLKSFVKQKLKDIFINEWTSKVNESTHYRLLKTTFKFETYFKKSCDKESKLLLKFRTRNHRLPVEVGRWNKIELRERKCVFCKNDIGDEYHYILICPPGRVAQSVGHLTRKSGVLGSIPGLATYFRFSFRFFKKGSCQLLAKVCAQSTG